MPLGEPLQDEISAPLTLKVGDNITTDHIMPAGAKILPYRSNVPKLSEFCFTVCDETFPQRAKAAGRSIIVGGANYGQGSSREHAALVPMYLGVRAVVAKSFARIHAANLINYGILPLTFVNADDYDRLTQGDDVTISGIFAGLESGEFTLTDRTTGETFALACELSPPARDTARRRAAGLHQGGQTMNAQVERAVEHFRALLEEQLRRVERMESASAQEKAANPKTVVGIVGGDGIGPSS